MFVKNIIISDNLGRLIDGKEILHPELFSIYNAYPNPFNPMTIISFELYDNLYSSIRVYNLSGQLMDIIQEGNLNMGTHSFNWNAEHNVSGIYFVSIQIGNSIKTQKLMLIK